MLKRIYRFAAIAVALCMLFTSVPVTTVSAQQSTGSNSDGSGNVITNGGFEASTGEATGWTSVITETEKDGITYQQDGTVLFNGHFASSDLLLKQTVAVTAGDTNKLSGKVRIVSGTPALVLDVTYYDAQNEQVEKVSVDFNAETGVPDTLQEVSSAEYTVPTGAVSAVVSVGMKGVGSCVWDEVALGKADMNATLLNGDFETWTGETGSESPNNWAANVNEGTVLKQADDVMLMLSYPSKVRQGVIGAEASKDLDNDGTISEAETVKYIVELKFKAPSADSGEVLFIDFQGNSSRQYKVVTINEGDGGKWIETSHTYNAPSDLTSLPLIIQKRTGTDIYVDDVLVYKSTDDTKTNLIKNGDFESVSGSIPTEWSDFSTAILYDIDITDGTYAPIFSGTTASSDVSLTSEKFSVVAGSNIDFTSDLLIYEGTPAPYIVVNYYKADDSKLDTEHKVSPTVTAGTWTTISSDQINTSLTVPADAVSATVTVGQNGIGQCIWDKVVMNTASGSIFIDQLSNGAFGTDPMAEGSAWTSVIAEQANDKISVLTDNANFWFSSESASSLNIYQDIAATFLAGSTDSNSDGDYADEGEMVTYTVKAKLKAMNTTVDPLLDFYGAGGGVTLGNGYNGVGYSNVTDADIVNHDSAYIGKIPTNNRYRQNKKITISDEQVGKWIDVEFTYNAPFELTALRLYIRERGIGTVYWEDVCVYKNGNSSENLLINGGFDVLTNNLPNNWSMPGGDFKANTHYGTQKSYNIAEGIQAAKFMGVMADSNVALTQEISVNAGEAYVLSAQTMRYEGSSAPYLNMVFYDASDVEKGRVEKNASATTTGVWENVNEAKVVVPDGAVKVVITLGQTGIGECLWDDVLLRPYIVRENILANGSFETLNAKEVPVWWNPNSQCAFGSSVMMVEEADGNHVLKFINKDALSMKVYQRTVNEVKPNTSYTFTGKLKVVENKGTGDGQLKALIDVFYKDIDGTQLTYMGSDNQLKEHRKSNFFAIDLNNTTDWQYVTATITTPEGTGGMEFNLGCQGLGSYMWDDVALVEGDKVADEITISRLDQLSADFRELMSVETQNATKEIGQTPNDRYEDDEPVEGQSNIIKNGDLELYDGVELEYWNLRANSAPYMEILENGGDEGAGDACVKMYVPVGSAYEHPFYEQWVDVIGGAEYQITYKYKVETTNEDGTCTMAPVVKAEYWTADQSTPGANCILETNHTGNPLLVDGQWHTYTEKITTSMAMYKMDFLLRSTLRGTNDGSTTIYLDDLEVYMTQCPEPLTLSTDQVFYYRDIEQDGKGTITTQLNTNFYPELAGAKVKVQIRDLTASVASGSDVYVYSREYAGTIEDHSEFDLSLLLGENNSAVDHTYEVVATLYDDAQGTNIKQVDVKNIYIADRPGTVAVEGTYHVYDATTGTFAEEAFNPEFAYHVSRNSCDNYMKLKESGINVVQMGTFTSAKGALDALDAAEAAGVMGFVALYNNMLSAGDDSNIENTILVVDAIKDHPALFGYGIMDEPFLNLIDPEKNLENSYRLIHSLDPNHPVMLMECIAGWLQESGKYVDMLWIDQYVPASTQNLAGYTEQAIAAVKDKKPVYVLLEAYRTNSGRYPTPNDLRNNIWQALIKGGDAVGYYSITDSEKNPETGKYTIPIWDALDGGALWQAICDFNTYEKELAYDHFVFDKSEVYTESAVIGDDYWYSSWKTDDGKYYMVVLSMLEDAEATQEVSIPLNKEGDAAYGRFNATALSGRITKDGDDNAIGEIVAGKDNLDMTLQGWEAILFEIESAEVVDVSLGAYDEDGTALTAVTAEGADAYTVNESVMVTAPITEDYNFVGWYAAETDTEGTVVGFTGDVISTDLSYTFTATEDTALVSVYKALMLTEDEDGVADSYRLSTDGTATIAVDTEGLVGIEVDGITVEESNYTVDAEAGTVVFDNTYLETLTAGAHTVTLVYSGGYSETVLTIVEALDVMEEKSDLTYSLGAEGDGASIYCNGEYGKFVSVEVDGNTVASGNYTVKEGSTIITFTEAYLNGLTAGTHNVKLNYTDGSVETSLVISAKTAAGDTTENNNQGNAEDGNAGSTEGNSGDNSVNVGSNSNDTGDHNHMLLWIMLLAVTAMVGALVVMREKRTAMK